MEEVPRRTSPVPLAFPCLYIVYLIRVEAEALLDYQGRAGIISIVRWNLRPVIFGVDIKRGWALVTAPSVPLTGPQFLLRGTFLIV